MCRNITELRGLQPPATPAEVEAAARQFVRKVTGVGKPTGAVVALVDQAVAEIATIIHGVLDQLPERRQPPPTLPPLRRPQVRARLGLDRPT